jgi:hypothetical protein
MAERARFTLQITLRDNYNYEPPLCVAIDLNEEVRIASRAVDEMKSGLCDFNGTVRLMKVREFRKSLFIQCAERLGALLAERMEDAEGWHDASRVEPARKQLGGVWRDY